MTPMQGQYQKIKEEYKDYIVLFRLGDFFEAFNDDAVSISRVLGITLTGRGSGETRYPMAGIPHHALKNYLPKLVEAGLKIAIADQVEEASAGKLVDRQVTKVITPGTVIDESSLDASKNNYIASILISENKNSQVFNLVYADLTTGLFRAFQTTKANILRSELQKLNPSEIIIKEYQKNRIEIIYKNRLEPSDGSYFNENDSSQILKDQLGVSNFKGFGIEEKTDLITAAGSLVKYLKETQKTDIKHIKQIKLYDYSDHMQLDHETIRNLELIFPSSGNDFSATVYNVLNKCESAMGKRKLRQWIIQPLVNAEMINQRLNAVEFFYKDKMFTSDIKDKLSQMSDLERIAGRIGVSGANPKDLVALKYTLNSTLDLIDTLNAKEDIPERIKFFLSLFSDPGKYFEIINTIIKLIDESILETAPANFNEGGVIKDEYNQKVSELRNLQKNAKQILAEIQQKEIQSTGISSLKISFNQVFGYYIEVTKIHINKVPQHYIRKQTLANAERYITEELKELESKILSAESELLKLEIELFLQIREKISEYAKDLIEIGDILAEIDVLSNFGFISREYEYTKPELVFDNKLTIKKGRHLVVERLVKDFIPNDVEFSSSSIIHLLTGPNMSGKSTYIRQVALVTLIAQIGCFVPAEKMEWSIVDRVFTRVGASDNLSRGESTFMVEMNETANILNNATDKSLIILDEVGRGTSTYDGVAIAWSVVEFIASKLKAKTLFATHYHELTELEKSFDFIKNYNVAVSDKDGEITFQHQIVKGATNRSYGVHVAKLAGIPDEVVSRANEILNGFEKKSKNELSPKTQSPKAPKKIHPEQLGLI